MHKKADRTSLLKNPPYKIIPPHLVDSKVGGALLHHLPLHVHLDQARGSDLVVHHPWRDSRLKWGILRDEDKSVLKHKSFFTKRVEKKVLSVLADPCCHVVVYALQAIFIYALQTIFDTQPSGKTMP